MGNIVPIEMRENIFKAFVQYRDRKDIVSGTGIGLAMARYLAELHQGMLVMDRELGCNRFILSIQYYTRHFRMIRKNNIRNLGMMMKIVKFLIKIKERLLPYWL